ncbi:MAG TPA: nuclear transport factor 2 family protein [Acidimicrobiales bacterium]
MGVIDIDPELLQRSADAALHAAEQGIVHMEAEYRGEIGPLMDTLVAQEPLAYAIRPVINADGSVEIPVETTRARIHDWYVQVRGASDMLPGWSLIEIRGEWYSFTEQITRARLKNGAPEIYETEVILLLPVTTDPGITGELCWHRTPTISLGTDPERVADERNRPDLRRELLECHDRHLDALRSGDVDGLVELLDDGAQAAIRDYVDDTGTLVALRGAAEHRAHYERFFETFDVVGIDLLHRVVQEWYLFHEVRLTVQRRAGADAGAQLSFRLAEFVIPTADGRMMVRIGHGTDPA